MCVCVCARLRGAQKATVNTHNEGFHRNPLELFTFHSEDFAADRFSFQDNKRPKMAASTFQSGTDEPPPGGSAI